MKTFKEFLVEMRQKHRKDYAHGKSGRVGGNLRYAGNQGYDKPDSRNSREASRKILRRELKDQE